MGTSPHSRRRFLRYVGAGSLAGLAGCASDALQESEPTTESTDGQTTKADERSTDAPDTQTMSTVFHLTSGSESAQQHALGNVANLLADESTETEDVVLVANAQGITAFFDDSPVADQVQDLLDKDVAIRVCENSMESFGRSQSGLLHGVETVPAGVGELTKLQARDGYAYIRVP